MKERELQISYFPSSDAWFQCGMNLDAAANQITGLISLHSRDVRMNDHRHAFIIP